MCKWDVFVNETVAEMDGQFSDDEGAGGCVDLMAG